MNDNPDDERLPLMFVGTEGSGGVRPYGDYVVRHTDDQVPEVARFTDIGWVLIGIEHALQDEDLAQIGHRIVIDPRTLICVTVVEGSTPAGFQQT